jgi:hypothetical protein
MGFLLLWAVTAVTWSVVPQLWEGPARACGAFRCGEARELPECLSLFPGRQRPKAPRRVGS